MVRKNFQNVVQNRQKVIFFKNYLVYIKKIYTFAASLVSSLVGKRAVLYI